MQYVHLYPVGQPIGHVIHESMSEKSFICEQWLHVCVGVYVYVHITCRDIHVHVRDDIMHMHIYGILHVYNLVRYVRKTTLSCKAMKPDLNVTWEQEMSENLTKWLHYFISRNIWAV